MGTEADMITLKNMVPLRTFDIHGHIPMHKRFFIVKKVLIFKTLKGWFIVISLFYS